MATRRDAVLFNAADVASFARHLLLGDHLVNGLRQLWVGSRERLCYRMLRSKLHRRCTEDRIDPCRKNADLLFSGVLHSEINQGPLAAADPVTLHGAHFFGPTWHRIQPIEEFVRILRDAQKPLLQFALLDQRIFMPPAATANNLLVRQHGGAHRAPVHFA